MELKGLLEEEPTPQILSKDIFNPDVNTNNIIDISPIKENGTINEVPEDEETIINFGDDTETTEQNYHPFQINQLTNITTSLEDIFKATINQMKINNKTQVDIEQCCYDFSKEMSRLKIGKDQNFQMRMIFDIFKRQLKEKELERIIEKCKIRVDEGVRAKGFNRLIEDANRRLEAQEQLESMKGKLDAELIIAPSKKYKDKQWKEIYNERFLKYQNEKKKKIEKMVEEKKQLEKKKEEEIIELCKVKKAPLNVVEEYGKRLHEDQKRTTSKGHVNKTTNKVTQEEQKGKNVKKQSQDHLKKSLCEDDETKIQKEETDETKEIIKIEEQEPIQVENLKINLKENRNELSKSQEKKKEKKILAFKINSNTIPPNTRKEPIPKLKKLKYTDFLPNTNNDNSNNNQRKIYDDKQTNKILNNFFANQLIQH